MSKRSMINPRHMNKESLENCCAFMKLYSAALYLLITYGNGVKIEDKGTHLAWDMLCGQTRNIARFGKMQREVMAELTDLASTKQHAYWKSKHKHEG